MAIACDAVDPLRRAPRGRARELAATRDATRPAGRSCERIAEVCDRVPGARAARLPRGAPVVLVLPPRRHHRAERLGLLQPRPPRPAPRPFYERGLADGTLTREAGAGAARVLLRQVQQPARRRPRSASPRRRAAPTPTSPTSTSAACWPTARTASNELSHLLLEVIDEMHLLQPSRRTCSCRARPPTPSSSTPCEVIRKGYGFPSLFNADARRRGAAPAGQVARGRPRGRLLAAASRSGAFGKEAYILTGYFNLAKVLELALHDGVDPRTGKQLGAATGDPARSRRFDDAVRAPSQAQLRHFVDVKIARQRRSSSGCTRAQMPAPVPLGPHRRLHREAAATTTPAAPATTTPTSRASASARLTDASPRSSTTSSTSRRLDAGRARSHALDADFAGHEALRQRLARTGRRSTATTTTRADALMARTSTPSSSAIDGRPNTRGRRLPRRDAADDLPRLLRLGDRRHARRPARRRAALGGHLARRRAPTATARPRSSARPRRWTTSRTGGTLLNMKFTPGAARRRPTGIDTAGAARPHATSGSTATTSSSTSSRPTTLREAQARPGRAPRPDRPRRRLQRLLLRPLAELQDEIIARTEHAGL